MYVSPRVMQQALNYINTSVSHAHSWKLIKPHMLQIIQVHIRLCRWQIIVEWFNTSTLL